MDLKTIKKYDAKYFMNTYGTRTNVCFSYGKGMSLFTEEGVEYTDYLGGIAVNALGHSHPTLVNMLKGQIDKYIHCSSLYYIESQALLAREIVKNSCAEKVFFSNSGAEANEGAIKLARLYFYKQGITDKYEIITLEKSFHGRTLATIAATGQEKYQKSFCPLTPKFKSVPKNNIEALIAAIDENTCALMVEPIQGESGVNALDYNYMQKVRKICDDKNILLIFDEVQCGMGRTGKLFGYEHYNIEPDIFTLAKALGGGFPIGAVCSKKKYAAFAPGDHGSTFGGNPLACTAGLAVFKAFEEENLVEKGNIVGQYLINQLNNLKMTNPLIKEIRGKGLMIGIQLSEANAVDIKNKLFDMGILVGSVGDSILRLLPPLIITKAHADKFINALIEVI